MPEKLTAMQDMIKEMELLDVKFDDKFLDYHLEKEKQQIIDAYDSGQLVAGSEPVGRVAVEYYNNEFKQKEIATATDKNIQSAKNLKRRSGFLNRHKEALPSVKCAMKIVTNDIDGEHIYLCQWNPYNEAEWVAAYNKWGYLGTCKVIEGKFAGIGFHAWEQNNSEFIYYSVCDSDGQPL